MDAALLARIQFAFTVGFHYIFPPLTIGLSWLIVVLMTWWRRTGDLSWGEAARFWVGLLAITFAVGVATGITMEFQFGTNWAAYSRFVGDIFGAPLAAEGIFAFFLESVFIAALVYGWNRLSVAQLHVSSILVAVGSTMSAFWILVANSWMQTPAGYKIVEGRAELVDFWAAVLNPSMLLRLFHTLAGAVTTGAFFMLGVSAWFLIKGRHLDFAKRSMKLALVVAALSSFIQLGLGHWHAVQVAHTQPEKLAAIEGIFETQSGAPALLFGIPDGEEGRMKYAVQVPGLLSLLAFGKIDAVVMGLRDVPREEWPPLALTFYPFHLMVMLGMLFIALGALGLFLLRRGKLFDSRWYLWCALLAVPLPFVANELGWITAEVGRQPWIVYQVMKTADAISPNVSAGHILASLAIFGTIYAGLFAAWLWLIVRKIKQGPGAKAAA